MKQELIKFVRQQQERTDKFDFTDVEDSDRADYLANVMYVNYKNLLDKLEQQDEPQIVKVKQFVAEWYEEHKHNLSNSLWEFTVELNEKTIAKGVVYTKFESWFIDHPRAYEVITSMENGYEVEEEPLFYIRLTIPSSSDVGLYLGFNKEGIFDHSYGKPHVTWGWKCTFTEHEIKSIDERYWAFAVPVKAFVEGYEVEKSKWVVNEGDLVIRKGCHEAKVYFVEGVDDDGILLVNGIKDEFFTDLDDRSVGEESINYFYENFRLLAKKENLEVEKVEV